MEKFAQSFFSMKMMALGMFIFLFAIGTATFLESAYDTQTAKIIIYNALWFEILLTYLGMNLISNIFKYNLFRREKIASLAFHLSFIIVLIGAGVTRYFGYEGMMIIREGEDSNTILSSDPHFWFKVNDGKMQYQYNEKMLMSEITSNYFSHDFIFPKHKNPIKIEFVKYEKKMIDSLVVNDSIKDFVLDIKTDGMKSNYLEKNNFLMIGTVPISFEKQDAAQGINLYAINGKLKLKSAFPLKCLPMAEMQKVRQSGQMPNDSLYEQIPIDTLVDLKTTTLYIVNGQQFVFKEVIKNAKKMRLPSGKRNVGTDYLTVKITDGKVSTLVSLAGGKDAIPEHVTFSFAGLIYEMEYGSTKIEIPFRVACRDFELIRYPGSNSPSSFSSQVTIVDMKNNYKRDQKIFMNHVMDYNGFRFFQSGYDQDEKGTHLSVNHDWWGTNITYIGYLLMFTGMILSIFAPGGRFREINEKLKKLNDKRNSLGILVALISMVQFTTLAQHENHQHTKPVYRIISEEHSEKLGHLLVQEFEGRISPMHTLCDKLLRDIANNTRYNNLNAVQTIFSMHMYPEHWMNEKIIVIPVNLRDRLKVGSFASYKELITPNGDFKLAKEYESAFQKPDSKRDEFDKKLVKLVDDFQMVQAIFSWQFMKIIPVTNAQNNTWYVPLSPELNQIDSTSSRIALEYISSLNSSAEKKSFSKSDVLLDKLIQFQRTVGKNVVPSETKVNIEIKYNKMNIFGNTLKLYISIGFGLLIVFFLRIFSKNPNSKKFKNIGLIGTILLAITFIYQGTGIGFRWTITEHAPWSNGYEAVVFISWVTMIAGFAFARKNPVILAVAAILASLMIFVTEMNLMDPQITPLQPVLKSYWLMIHVAIITGSYGFLGLACILGLMNLILYIFRNENNGKSISLHILEITYISEMTMTIGLLKEMD
ncbi:MAG: cytochrome c biogenesis protein ResB [Flavobacteriia bacterium]|nr:cytochrome c biogenesis protein ResB [Flavobacteriia bacterium]